MQIPPQSDKAPRYYHLHLQEDLLEGWTLIREWGYFPDRETAESALMATRDEQAKRGYQVVFMQAGSG
jgi:predicted DNA-binding WGR domain protein